jgi:fumarate hydratase class II
MKFRIEKDTMGEVQVPAEKYWEHKQNDPEIILK